MKGKYNKIIFIAGIFAFVGFLSGNPQQLTHDASVVNIEVPVRVYDGMRFVDNLKLEDFEVYENDILQKVEAVYLVRKTDVVNYFGGLSPVPNTANKIPEYQLKTDSSIKRRVFLIDFEMDDYLNKTNEAIDYLFENVLIETDVVLIVTPFEQWKITMSADNVKRRVELAGELKSRLKKSLRKSGSSVKVLIQEMHDLSVYHEEDIMLKLMKVDEILDQLTAQKVLNEKRFRNFADFFKPIKGQKHVFIFYQEETYSIPSEFQNRFERKVLDRQSKIDKKLIRELFSDAETTVHFMYLRKFKSARGDVEYKEEGAAFDGEMSGDIFQAFRDLAVTTGGLTESTFNPVFAMKRATEAAENYYLLYYQPTPSESDKSFKKITVKVKSGDYKVIHRAGYIDQ